MADKERDKEKEKKILPPKVPRPNYQMWIILALTAVVLGITFLKNARGLIDIQTSTFESMIASNDVKRIQLYQKDKLVQITLKAEALQNAKYRLELEKNGPLGLRQRGPHYLYKNG